MPVCKKDVEVYTESLKREPLIVGHPMDILHSCLNIHSMAEQIFRKARCLKGLPRLTMPGFFAKPAKSRARQGYGRSDIECGSQSTSRLAADQHRKG